MKIAETYPPNYELMKIAFPNLEEHRPIFCYGDTIYNPFKEVLTQDRIYHEEVHSKQQGDKIDEWYYKYINDPKFRLEQEIMAYGAQYAYVKKHVQDAKLRDWIKEKCAEGLCSELYGSLLTYGEAESKIRNYAKTI